MKCLWALSSGIEEGSSFVRLLPCLLIGSWDGNVGPDLDLCSQLLDEVSKTFDQTFMDEAL